MADEKPADHDTLVSHVAGCNARAAMILIIIGVVASIFGFFGSHLWDESKDFEHRISLIEAKAVACK